MWHIEKAIGYIPWDGDAVLLFLSEFYQVYVPSNHVICHLCRRSLPVLSTNFWTEQLHGSIPFISDEDEEYLKSPESRKQDYPIPF